MVKVYEKPEDGAVSQSEDHYNKNSLECTVYFPEM